MYDYNTHIVLWEQCSIRITDVCHGRLGSMEQVKISGTNGSSFLYVVGKIGKVCFNSIYYKIDRHHLFHAGRNSEIIIYAEENCLEYYMITYQANMPPFLHSELKRLLESDNPFNILHTFRPSNPPFFNDQFKKITDDWKKHTPMSRLCLKTEFYKIVSELYKQLQTGETGLSPMNIFEQAKKHLDSHFTEPVSIQLLISALNTSSSNLNRIFKRYSGKSPQQYLIDLRLETAQKELAMGNFTIREIANACGFQDKYYFSRIFKSHYGVSPGVYRKTIEPNRVDVKLCKKKDKPVSLSAARSGSRMALDEGQNKGPASEASGKVVISNFNHITSYNKVPERIVCLSHSEAEICAALGLADKIIGIAAAQSSVDDCIPEYRGIISKIHSIKLQQDSLPAFEDIRKLKPDFVYGTAYSFRANGGVANAEDFKRFGIQIYVSKCTYTLKATLDDVYADILNIGRIFNVEKKAAEIITKMQARVKTSTEGLRQTEKPQKVFIYDCCIREQPFTAGMSLESELVRLAGGRNIFEDIPAQFTLVSWERVVQAEPDFIIVHQFYDNEEAQNKIEALKRKPELKNIPAIKRNRIIKLRLSHVFPNIQNADVVFRLKQQLI